MPPSSSDTWKGSAQRYFSSRARGGAHQGIVVSFRAMSCQSRRLTVSADVNRPSAFLRKVLSTPFEPSLFTASSGFASRDLRTPIACRRVCFLSASSGSCEETDFLYHFSCQMLKSYVSQDVFFRLRDWAISNRNN